jgi:hypothetical protein
MSTSRCTHPNCQLRCDKCGKCPYADPASGVIGKNYHAKGCSPSDKPKHQQTQPEVLV